MGLRLDALTAGRRPNTMPMTMENTTAMRIAGTLMAVGVPMTDEMSRAMMMTVFYRLAGSPEGQMNAAKAVFNDVHSEWFAPYVRWAATQGVTGGTSANPPLFSPDMQVTRQQVAVMLYGFAGKSLGLKLEGAADLSRYADGGQVADWAQVQVAWAVENGIMTAINGKLEPNANAGRGDVAMMLMAFGKKYL